MSQVWCTRAAGVAAALLLSGSFATPGAPAVATGARTGALPAREPVPVVAALAVDVSPVLVPPGAPVDLTVRGPAFGGREVEVQVTSAGRWVTVARVRLGRDGRGAARVTRSTDGTYAVRAVATVAAGVDGVAAASRPNEFAVTRRGRGDATAYRYLYVRRGAPARWNPCAPVTYRVRGADAASLADLREALRRVSYETGVRFVDRGTAAGVPGARGFRYDADLVVAWADAEATPLLGANRAAVGGFERPVDGRGGRPRIRNGFVVLDLARTRDLERGFGAGVTHGQVLLHELGHAMGLDHVDAEHQLMRPALQHLDATLYGAGDLTALRRLGRAAGCV